MFLQKRLVKNYEEDESFRESAQCYYQERPYRQMNLAVDETLFREQFSLVVYLKIWDIMRCDRMAIDLVRSFLKRHGTHEWVNRAKGVTTLWALLAKDLFHHEIIINCGEHHFFNKGNTKELFSLGKLFRLVSDMFQVQDGETIESWKGMSVFKIGLNLSSIALKVMQHQQEGDLEVSRFYPDVNVDSLKEVMSGE